MLPVSLVLNVLIIAQVICMERIVRQNVNVNSVHVIQLMVRAVVHKDGMEHFVMNEFARTMLMGRDAPQYVNVRKITRTCVIHGRENVIVKLAGVAALVIVHAHF